MDKFIRYQRNLLKIIIALSVIVFTALMFSEYDPSLAWGWGLGSLVGLVVFQKRASFVLSLPNIPQEEWAKAGIKSNFTTLGVIIIAFIAAMLLDFFNVWAVIAGVLLERIVLRGDGWLRPGALMEPETEAADSGEEVDK